MTKILGIDPGSRIVGYAIIKQVSNPGYLPKHFKIEEVGVLQVDAKKLYSDRLGLLHIQMAELIEEIDPDICVIEKSFSGVNLNSAIKLGEARGALIAAVKRLQKPLFELAPTTVKKTITGLGLAKKEQVCQMLEQVWGFQKGSLPYDATDALAIALSYGLSGIKREAFSKSEALLKLQKKPSVKSVRDYAK